MKKNEHPLNVHPAEVYHDHAGSGRWTYAVSVKVLNAPAEVVELSETEYADATAAWWVAAEDAAARHGLCVEQSGRSGGWCVFTTAARVALDARKLADLHAEGGPARWRALDVAERVGYAAEDVRALLQRHVLIELALDARAVRCDDCGGPCDAEDAVTDDVVTLCGSFYGNGCADKVVPA